MNNVASTIVLCFVLLCNASAQDINKVFKNMPRDIVYGLNPELNEHLLDSPKDTTKFIATAIYDNIRRTAINSEFISLQTSEAGSTEIRLLPLVNESKIICVVQTVCGVICDSQISFYTDKWEPIDGASLFPEKDINWFIKSDVDKSSEKFEHAMLALNMSPMKFTISPEEAIISVAYDAKSFLSMEDYKVIEPFLIKELKILKWDRVRFK